MKSLLWVLLFPMGCQYDDPCIGTRDILDSPEGMIIVSEEHELGWGKTECFQCHPVWSIHQAGCTDLLADDEGEINALVDVNDTTTCISCHGSNGVPDWHADTGSAE